MGYKKIGVSTNAVFVVAMLHAFIPWMWILVFLIEARQANQMDISGILLPLLCYQISELL